LLAGWLGSQVLAYPEAMTFTVVRAVRGAEPTTSEPGGKLQRTVQNAVSTTATAMDLPYAERVIRLDFTSADFPQTTPGSLSVNETKLGE
jgi:hypothetical protein